MEAVATAETEAVALRRGKIRRLNGLGRACKGRLRIAGACGALAGWMLIPQAAAIAWAVQQVLVEHASPRDSMAPLCALLMVGLLRAALAWISRRQADEAVEAIRADLRNGLIRRLLAGGPLWLRQRRSGELAELMGTHADAMEGYFGGYLLARAEVIAVPLALLIAVFCVDRVVGAILLVTLPLIPLFMMLVGWGAEAASRQQLKALARMGGYFADRLRGLGVIRLYGRGDAELAGIRDAAEGVRVRSLKVLRIAFLSSAVLEFFASLSVAMVAVYLGLTYLGMLDLRGAPLSLGMGVFCLLLAPEYYAPLRRLATHYHDRANALAALDEIESALEDSTRAADAAHVGAASRRELLPLPSSTTLEKQPQAGAEARGGTPLPQGQLPQGQLSARPAPTAAAMLEVCDLVLRPLGAAHDVLTGITFDLNAGGGLALCGPSGSGKSTLLDALAGWLLPTAGSLSIPEATRIGYASQRPYLFHGSIADNLRMANPQASEAELHSAAEAAQVLRFAHKLPHGLDTMIGERGFGLSGGEARRIALARVFLRDPQLLLLDEPTAFLDSETETALLAALAEFARGRTLVLATHSQAAMRLAGQVLWLPDGVISPAEGMP
ncbi:thiol reductant ABC exporter subunit CydD [Pseudoxanthomonas sacheonensis]|uniref:ATP-binding cassette subfamily C protein CydD n=1 Tax=Pseudoxanthomonas sacheonensis TaxID=443615 RepID=A0ABU1RTW4_9GAMM|nr:thiol reductant ABC exporter subunit CydD [Pseudoxanthomonas sacheonensis]MDR6841370.1 ATP-binding cassette subfamily C protein CydD [Pseudoxanthomonas sacheonensis]